MTVLLPAWLQAGSYNAEIDRTVGTALLNPQTALTSRGGVRLVGGGEFAVTAKSPASMIVSVAAGMAFVQGGYTGTQGVYTVVNDASFDLTVGSSNGTNPRIDLVILEILDSAYSGPSNLGQVRIVSGVAASSPQPPTITGNYILLAQIRVSAGVTSITSPAITDLRPFASALGAPVAVRNITERNSLPNKSNGLRVAMMDNAWEIHTYYGGQWYGEDQRIYNVTTAYFTNSLYDYGFNTVVDRVKIVDPGFQYMLRLDTDIATTGARVNSYVYCENLPTTAYTNFIAHGQTLPYDQIAVPGSELAQRIRINRVFPQVYTGNRWVTIRVAKDPAEDTGQDYQILSWQFYCAITLIPIRPNGYVANASTGGQL